MNCLMGMSRKPVGEKLHFHVGIKTHFDVDIYNFKGFERIIDERY